MKALRGERRVRFAPAWLCLLLAGGTFVFTACDAPKSSEPIRPPFTEEEKADIIIRNFSDDVNRILKPKQTEGAFLATFDMKGVMELAKHQPGRELAVVILIFFNASDTEKLKWVGLLKGVGYHRVVFLRAGQGTQINGLPILEDPNPAAAPVTKAPQSKADLSPPSADLQAAKH